jgi:hypothetical protein
MPSFVMAAPCLDVGDRDLENDSSKTEPHYGANSDSVWRARHNLGPSLVSSDELIGNIVQVIAHDLRLRPDRQNIVAYTLDQRCLPARPFH